MASSTLFKKFNQPIGNRSLLLITKDIAEGKYKDLVEPIRMAIGMGKADRVDRLKKELPAFTPSGTFEGGRKMEYLTMYSGFVHLDFDKLSSDELAKAKSQVQELPTTFACFTSPSGNGLKVFIEVDTSVEHHSIAYKQVQEHYEQYLGIDADPKCKDVTRLCFVSHDTEAYRNIQNTKFKVALPPDAFSPVEHSQPITPPTQQAEENPFVEIQFDDCVSFTENKNAYIDGNRNNFVYKLACNCNRRGIPFEETIELIRAKYDLKDFEINASVKSAYNHNATQFGEFKNIKPPKQENAEDDMDYLQNTPLYNDEIFEALPDILREGTRAFTDKRQRDVFLTGALAILSGCLPNVEGEYAREIIYPNLFAFIIAPAASGKGALKFAKNLGDKYQDHLLECHKVAKDQYETELAEHKAAQRDRKKGEPVNAEEPEKPPFKVAFIPANSSYAKILQHIEQNEGSGIICETEADSMGNVMKQEWGGYSDMLRKAFHHETISLSRKTNDEYISIKEPKISIALSGTPGQVGNLISSAEDGLFSRFIFYTFKVEEQIWQDVSPYGNPINLNDHFSNLASQIFSMVQFFEQSNTIIKLTRDQWNTINEVGQKWLTEITIFTADEAASVAKRLGVILYRLAMIFTALRKFENGEITQEVLCTDADFEIALNITNTFIEHSVLMFNNLPKQEKIAPFKGGNKQQFFTALPVKFKREEAVRIGIAHNIKERTVGSLLKKLVEQAMLTQPEYGYYQKVS
jgi:hypothetical protein